MEAGGPEKDLDQQPDASESESEFGLKELEQAPSSIIRKYFGMNTDLSPRDPKRSPSEETWLLLKRIEGAQSESIDKLMQMVELEEAKAFFIFIWSKVNMARKRQHELSPADLDVAIVGNEGIGMWPSMHVSSCYMII